jgi:syntaxin-binding protein 1
VIESISNRRELQPEFEAIYMLMPTTQNVDRIIRDFSQRQQYAAAHLFFIEGRVPFRDLPLRYSQLFSLGLPEPLFERLTTSPAEPYLKALKELFINFSGKC